MEKKELLKQIIRGFQKELPVKVKPRDIVLPAGTEKIISVAGVRRSGKTSVLFDTINKLLEKKITPEQILFLNFDDERMQFKNGEFDLIIRAYHELYPEIKKNEFYVFFDEIQMADNWEQFVRRLYDTETRHIYISGSNSRMLATDIATSLRGRSLQFEVFPLSFKEYCDFKNIVVDKYVARQIAKLKNAFNQYLLKGGFPEVVLDEYEQVDNMLQEYFFIMLHKDLVERYEVGNLPALKYFVKRIIANITKPTSINKIFNELKSGGFSLSKNLLYELAEYTEAVYLFNRLTRFDYKYSRETFSDKKYYLIDNGFKHALSVSTKEDYGTLLENAVFLWLRRQMPFQRGLHFYYGKKECDFVIFDRNKPEKLIQVCWDVSNADTLKRELEGLEEAGAYFKCKDLTIITAEHEEELKHGKYIVKIVAAWKTML